KYSIGARGKRGADDCAQVVGIFDAVEQHNQVRVLDGLLISGIAMGRPDGDNPLVRGAVCDAIQSFTRLEPHRNIALAAELDDLRESWAPGPAGDQHAIERSPGRNRFPYRMDPRQYH